MIRPKLVVVPNSNVYDVACPCGFTVPFSVAAAGKMFVAAPVVTTGALGVPPVVNIITEPRVVPCELVATSR